MWVLAICSDSTERKIRVSKSIDSRLNEINQINILQQRDQWVNNLHPLVKLFLAIIYLLFVVSLNKYSLSQIISFAIFPFIMYNLADLRAMDAFKRLRLILPIVMAVGIFNPIFDRQILLVIGGVKITGGIISMLTLMLKGVYAVLAAYALIATTSIEDICYALRLIKVPKIIVTVILLIYRYLFILVEEAGKIVAAYSLRAPSQKGFAYKTWGPLIGQWLLRSMDKAEEVYSSMCLRGYNGEFSYSAHSKLRFVEVLFLIGWIIIFAVLKYTNVVSMIGSLFVR